MPLWLILISIVFCCSWCVQDSRWESVDKCNLCCY